MGRVLAVSAVLVGGIIVVGMLATTKPPPPRPVAVTKPRLSREEVYWLSEHPENGQSLAGHRADCQPVAGRTIYLVPTIPSPFGRGLGEGSAARTLASLVASS